MKKTRHHHIYIVRSQDIAAIEMKNLKDAMQKYKKVNREQVEDPTPTKRLRQEVNVSGKHTKIVDFLIVGAQKAGTTALVKNINKHPDIFCKNECQFFTFCWGFGVDWYKTQLQTTKPIVGEKTPELIYCDDCAPRIKEVCPDAKFILCLRDPIKRAFSSWNMEIQTKKESLPFSECVDRELATMMGERRTYGTAEYHFIQRGFYLEQIERFRTIFPDRNQMLIVVAERLRSDPVKEYSRVVEFLGASNYTFLPEDDNVGEYKSPPMSPEMYERLRAIYAPHNERLFAFLGYDIPEWGGGQGGAKNSSPMGPVTTEAPPPPIPADALVVAASVDPMNRFANEITSADGVFATIGSRSGTDKIYHHGYYRYYPIYLERFRDVRDAGMLEIGIDESHSLGLWLEYFSRAFIYGIDIGLCKDGERYKIFQADQSKRSELEHIVNTQISHPIFFIIDDGSHIPEHQLLSFDYLFASLLQPGGVYIIEDIETSYWTRNGLYGYSTNYGYRHQYSLIEIFKDLLDDVNSEFLSGRNKESQDRRLDKIISALTRNEVSSISFGQNCVIITKKTQAEHDNFDNRRYRFAKNL